MSTLPQGWISVPIGSICSLKNGRAFKSTEWTDIGLPIVRIQNLNNLNGKFNFYSGDIEERYHLKGGELLFAWSGTPGTSFGAHVWNGGEAVLNQHIFRVDFDQKSIDRRYFRFAINQKLGELIDIAHGGVGLRHVTKGKFESTEILLPPLPEQQRIADKLDSVLARVDAARARLDRVPVILKRLRRMVLSAATTGRLRDELQTTDEQKNDWITCDLGSVADVGTGSTPLRSNASYFASTGTPWVTSAATAQRVVASAEEFVTAEAIKAHRLKTYPIGTLLVAMYGEGKTRGQVTELAIPATINQACAAVRVDEKKADRRFVRLVLEANYFEMRELAEGGNQPNLNLTKIKTFPLVLPPLEEQREIVHRVNSLFAVADKIQMQYERAIQRLEKLTPALLAKAFRGELVPQDPNEEPAERLLERLKAKTDASGATGRRSKRSPRSAVLLD